MSWNILEIGERKAVRAAVENNTTLPESVKALVLKTLHERVPEHSKFLNGVKVSGYGHENNNDESAIGCIGRLEIEPLKLTT